MKTSIVSVRRILTLMLLVFPFFMIPAGGEGVMIKPGESAPDFSLISNTGDTVTLSEFRGKKNVVLVFYPGDATPVCTKQLCEIRDDYSSFQRKNAVVFGVNPADKESHERFARKQSYQFPLLVDSNKEVAEKYGVKGLFIKRTVFIIDMDGTVVFVKKGKPPVSEILANIPQ